MNKNGCRNFGVTYTFDDIDGYSDNKACSVGSEEEFSIN